MLNAMSNTKREKNYYEILEIPTNAAPQEVHEGYHRAKNAYAQDSVALYSLMNKDECAAILNLIEEAYSIISDPNKRQAYDSARGITNTYYSNDPRRMHVRNEMAQNEIQSDKEGLKQNSITKIVASNKYQLSFTKDQEMERLIEETTDWSVEMLKKVREYKNVEVNRLADLTKVGKTYLLYIENEEMDKLPAVAYVRGFVYQYAKCLKLNPELVASSYIFRLKKIKGIK